MYTFPQLIKNIRDQAGLTQTEFADALGVSAILIAMVETGQKDVSKNLLIRLAKALQVHPSSITPFLFVEEDESVKPLSKIEQQFIVWGEKLQEHLIFKRAPLLRKHARQTVS